MRLNKKEFIHEFTKNQASFREIHTNILEGMDVHGSNFIVLMCAIIIASIGLNMNSTAVIIGAMLISPLMGSITGIGYGIGTFNSHLLKSALKIFILAVIVSIVTSTIYFAITPITTPGSEILARSEPTIWDVLIAFFGGIVGMIGITRKEPTNVIPGVAIATALMPPLCTVGYGLANYEIHILFGAAYLFLINCFFISVGTLLVTKTLHIPVWINVDRSNQKRVKYVITLASIVVMIPSVFSATRLIQDSVEMGQLDDFAKKELQSHYVLDSSIDKENKEVTFVVVGDEITENDLLLLSTRLKGYGLGGMQLTIQQNKDDFSTVKQYLTQLENYQHYLTQSKKNMPQEISSNPMIPTKTQILSELKTLYQTIDDAYIGFLSKADLELPVLLIYTADEALIENQEQLKEWLAIRLEMETVEVVIKTKSVNKKSESS